MRNRDCNHGKIYCTQFILTVPLDGVCPMAQYMAEVWGGGSQRQHSLEDGCAAYCSVQLGYSGRLSQWLFQWTHCTAPHMEGYSSSSRRRVLQYIRWVFIPGHAPLYRAWPPRLSVVPHFFLRGGSLAFFRPRSATKTKALSPSLTPPRYSLHLISRWRHLPLLSRNVAFAWNRSKSLCGRR